MDRADRSHNVPLEECDALTDALRAVDTGAMTRRQFAARAVALGLSVSAAGGLLAACGGDGGAAVATDAPAAMNTALPDQLTIWNWTGYMSPKVLSGFEAKYGITVVIKPLKSNEAAAKALETEPSQYDVLFSDGSSVASLIANGRVLPLDTALLPNLTNVTAPSLAKPTFDPETDGHKYTTPYMFGTVGFAVRIDVDRDPVDSWATLFDPANAGKVGMIQLTRELLGAGLFSLGHSPNTTDQAELDEATQALIRQKKLYAKGIDMTAPAKVITGGNPYTHCWDGDAISAINKVGLDKVKYVLPQDGYVVWSDALCIPKKAANPYAAHLFLDYLLAPENAAACANFTGYQPAVSAADPLIKSTVQRALRPTDDVIAKGVFIEDLGDFNAQYEAAFDAISKA
jgi:spermidine/putrescine transport system substrate-binding protein